MRPDPAGRRDDGFASPRERRMWLIGYVVVMLVIAAGALRILIRQFG